MSKDNYRAQSLILNLYKLEVFFSKIMQPLRSALILKSNKSMMLSSNPYHSFSVEGKKHTSPPQSCLPRKKDYMNARLQTEVNEKHVPPKEQLDLYFERLNGIKKKQKGKQSKKNSSKVCLNDSQKQKPKSPQPMMSKFAYRQGATEVGSLIREKKKLKKHRRPTSSSKGKKDQKKQLISILSNLNNCKQTEKLKKSPIRVSKPLYICKQNQLSNKSVRKLKTDMSCLSTVPQTSSVQFFEQVGEGTFGRVYKGRLKNSKKVVAIKKALQDKRCVNRQAEIVGMLDNPFVIRAICNYVTQENDEEYLNIVTEYYSSNLYTYFKQSNSQPLISFDLKIIFYQILRGLAYLHSLSICHRDIKPENILLKDKKIAICDFGSAKILVPGETSLPYICSRCYRAPQLMFAATKYTVSIDMWSMGCVMLEALNGKPLFIGENSIDHLIEVIKILGTPTEEQVLNMNPNYDLDDYNFPNILKKPWTKIFPKADPLLLNLIESIIVYNPKQRLTALEALTHKYFDEIRDKPTSKYIENELGLKLLSFTKNELKGQEHLDGLLVPDWY